MGDPTADLNSKTGWPIIETRYQAVRNLSGANALMCMIIIPGLVAYFDNMASVTRLAWSFGTTPGCLLVQEARPER